MYHVPCVLCGIIVSLSLSLSLSPCQLVSKLRAAEATIQSLSREVQQLSSSESLARVRENYSSGLREREEAWRQAEDQLRSQLQTERENCQEQVRGRWLQSSELDGSVEEKGGRERDGLREGGRERRRERWKEGVRREREREGGRE